ncbi:hypothetical protein COMA2_30015 [Candidatus Nitrospira nitrificans]|uniref:Uncharacterized protein n=1 Tax=Candidatus Nitrospira nitrificans TaxID=1742973 RepID=A0A0S4LM34_9BACT|nr:hypothetical protein COMA2_30015 [Candidatus Nitrospira nitrificans]
MSGTVHNLHVCRRQRDHERSTFVLRPDQREPALNVAGTQVTVLASNAATQSSGITLQQGEEGAGPPPHSHDWGEIGFSS